MLAWNDRGNGRVLVAVRKQIEIQLRPLVNDPDDLEDLTQDCLIRAWARKDSWRGESLYTSWVHRLVRNEFVSWLRKRQTRLRSARQWAKESGPPLTRDVAQAVIDRVVARQLLGTLGAWDRRILELTFLSGLPSAEVGRRLGLAPSSTRCRIMRLKNRLAPGIGPASAPLR